MDSVLETALGFESQQKRPCLEERSSVVDLGDRISDLPDHIIAHILSFLQSEEAIRTCILCSRWRYLWKGITSIRVQRIRDPIRFPNLVEHVLQNCSSTDILAFELYCPLSIDLSRLNTWIGSICSRKIEKLSVNANNADDYDLPETPLPNCVLSYTTLVALKLDCFNIQIPESIVCFPCLKSLDLHVILTDHHDVVNRLLSLCPVLERLYLHGVINPCKELEIDISVPTLRNLILRLTDVGSSNKREHGIIINTPKLEDLSIEDNSFSRYVVKNLAWFSHVYVHYGDSGFGLSAPKYVNRLLDLLREFVISQVLTLLWDTLDVFGSALSYTWPTFPLLMTLILHLSVNSVWTCLPKLLHSAPRLKALILDVEMMYDAYGTDSDDDIDQWTLPDIVPNCLLEHLELIGIQHFIGNKDELQLVEYLLNNALVLKGMMIGCLSEFTNEEVVNKLLTFPRASKTCDVQTFERVGFNIDSLNEVTLWGV